MASALAICALSGWAGLLGGTALADRMGSQLHTRFEPDWQRRDDDGGDDASDQSEGADGDDDDGDDCCDDGGCLMHEFS